MDQEEQSSRIGVLGSEMPHDHQGKPFYNSLPTKTSFRLIKLHATAMKTINSTSESLNSAILTTLQMYDLEKAPPFKALSYSWGPPYRDGAQTDVESTPEFDAEITCNGTTLAVTRNVYNALIAVREKGLIGYWWIDAICINQDDLDERSGQVLMMGDIYALASLVVAWLGPTREGVEDIAWTCREFVSAVENFQYDAEGVPVCGYPHQLQDSFWASLGLEPPLPRLLRAAKFYDSCRWFSRAWVIQEALLAQKVILLCGL